MTPNWLLTNSPTIYAQLCKQYNACLYSCAMHNVHVVHVRDVLVVKTVYTILEKEELGALRKEQKDK